MVSTGTHCILELYDCPAGLLNDQKHLRDAIRDAAIASKSTLLEEVQHSFTPQGVTALGLLAESHISVHTWPERGYAAADVFTCGEHTLPERACELLVRRLQARRYSLQHIERGMNAPNQKVATLLPGAAVDQTPGDAGPEETRRCRVRSFARTSG